MDKINSHLSNHPQFYLTTSWPQIIPVWVYLLKAILYYLMLPAIGWLSVEMCGLKHFFTQTLQIVGSVAEWVKASFLRRPWSNGLGSTRTLVTLLRPWIRRFTMIISAWWLRTSSKFSGQEFEEIHRNIGSSETPKLVRIPPITK